MLFLGTLAKFGSLYKQNFSSKILKCAPLSKYKCTSTIKAAVFRGQVKKKSYKVFGIVLKSQTIEHEPVI